MAENWGNRPKTLKELIVIPEGMEVKFERIPDRERRDFGIEEDGQVTVTFMGNQSIFLFNTEAQTELLANNINDYLREKMEKLSFKKRNMTIFD